MKKIMSIITCVLMLAILIPVTQAGTNTIKVVEMVSDGTNLDYTWVPHNDSDWYTFNNPTVDVYSCEPTDTEDHWSLPTEGVTHRGQGITRVNISIVNTYNYGIIFRYQDTGVYYWAGVYTVGGNPRFGIIHNILQSTTILANTSNIDLSKYCIESDFTVLKVLYNPYSGHVMLKAWNNTDTEPWNWTLDYTNSSLVTTSTIQWGLYAWAGHVGDYFDFYGTNILDLHYDTRLVEGAYIPTIEAPNVNTDIVDDIFNSTDILTAIPAWNALDSQSFLVNRSYNLAYPTANVHIFSAWDYDTNSLGFLVYDENDDANSSMDWLAFVFDVQHDNVLNAGDKYYVITKGTGASDAYVYDGAIWVETGEQMYDTYLSTQTPITRYAHTSWAFAIRADAVIPSGTTLSEFADSGEYLGLSIYGDVPEWCWNNWDESTDTNFTSFGNATGGAYNDTTNEFDFDMIVGPMPRDTNLGWFGDFRFIGYTATHEPDYIDLTDLDGLTVSDTDAYGYAYPSCVWHVNRYALNCGKLSEDNISKVKVPENVLHQFFFGWFTKSVPVTTVVFYGVNTTDYKRTLITPTAVKSGNYTLDPDDIDTYDVICVILNPSTLDTSNWLFKLLYKNDVASST